MIHFFQFRNVLQVKRTYARIRSMNFFRQRKNGYLATLIIFCIIKNNSFVFQERDALIPPTCELDLNLVQFLALMCTVQVQYIIVHFVHNILLNVHNFFYIQCFLKLLVNYF